MLSDLRTVTPKSQILEDAGYTYSFDRMLYVNREARKAFSVEFVEDHREDQLQERIREENPSGGWRFYFNSPPSDSVRRELVSVLE